MLFSKTSSSTCRTNSEGRGKEALLSREKKGETQPLFWGGKILGTKRPGWGTKGLTGKSLKKRGGKEARLKDHPAAKNSQNLEKKKKTERRGKGEKQFHRGKKERGGGKKILEGNEGKKVALWDTINGKEKRGAELTR